MKFLCSVFHSTETLQILTKIQLLLDLFYIELRFQRVRNYAERASDMRTKLELWCVYLSVGG